MNYQQSASEIDAIAARWVWRLDREAANPELMRQLEEWLAGDSRRRGAFLRAQAVWEALDVSAHGRMTSNFLGAVEGTRVDRPRIINPKRLLAASTGVIALVASIIALYISASTPDDYETAVGEIRQMPLADGSTATINTHSALTVSMSATRRLIDLKEGEAWFRVAKDASRPFIVEAGRVRVRALGTAFSVRRSKKGANILVSEGLVETWVSGAEGHIVRIGAGARAFVAENAAISQRAGRSSEIDRALAWRVGKLDLAGDTLGEAVAEFNRYNVRKLVIADKPLGQRRLYGVFRTDDPEGFAHAVSRSLGVPVSLPDANEIKLGE